jgi:hypothetical protein
MLEAARRLDEAALESGGEAVEAERLAGRSDAMAALREVFHAVAREARSQAPDTRGASGAIEALGSAGDRLLLRPGRPARLRLGGVWREARDASLAESEYAELRARLLPDAADAAGAARGALAALPGNRWVRVRRLEERGGETLWIQPAGLAAPATTRLLAAPEDMETLLAHDRGLVVIGGDERGGAERVLHALVADRLARHAELVLLVGGPGTYRHAEGAGVLVEVDSRGAGEALATLEPRTLAIEAATLPDGSLATLAGVRRILALAPAGKGEPAVAAWLAGLSGADRGRAAAWLATAPATWIEALPAEGTAETLPIAIRALQRAPVEPAPLPRAA